MTFQYKIFFLSILQFESDESFSDKLNFNINNPFLPNIKNSFKEIQYIKNRIRGHLRNNYRKEYEKMKGK